MNWVKHNIRPLLASAAVLFVVLIGLDKVAQWMREQIHEDIPELAGPWQDPDAIRYIIVHHSVSDWGNGAAVVEWHTGPPPHKGWDRPGYHAVIGNGYATDKAWKKRAYDIAADGKVDFIVSEDLRVNGVRFGNRNSMQVSLIGNFDVKDPTEKQMAALIDLLSRWCIKYALDPRKAIYGHGEMQRKIGREGYSKTCPGTHVDMDALRQAVYDKMVEQVVPEWKRRVSH